MGNRLGQNLTVLPPVMMRRPITLILALALARRGVWAFAKAWAQKLSYISEYTLVLWLTSTPAC